MFSLRKTLYDKLTRG